MRRFAPPQKATDMSTDPFTLTPSLASKLGSIAQHVDEGLLGPRGHPFDLEALRTLLADPEVSAWLGQMYAMAMLPVKR